MSLVRKLARGALVGEAVREACGAEELPSMACCHGGLNPSHGRLWSWPGLSTPSQNEARGRGVCMIPSATFWPWLFLRERWWYVPKTVLCG